MIKENKQEKITTLNNSTLDNTCFNANQIPIDDFNILMLALSYGGRTNFEGLTKDRYMRPVILDLLHIQTLIQRISKSVEPVDEWTEDLTPYIISLNTC